MQDPARNSSTVCPLIRLLKKPWFVLLSMFFGILVGILNKDVAVAISPIGDAYLAFLSMCVIPIMFTALFTSIGRLLSSRDIRYYLKRTIVVFLIGLFITSAIGLGIGAVGNPGRGLDQKTLETLGKVLIEAEGDVSKNDQTNQNLTGSNFVSMIIPSNIFKALYEGNSLQILFVSIVLGITIGLLPSEKSAQLLEFTDIVFSVFEKAISLAMYFLPVGLLCMMAGQVALTGIHILLSMTKFVILVHTASLLLILLSSVLIAYKSKIPVFYLINELREPIIIAFGTRNSYATMPIVFDTLRDKFQLPESLINLVVPLSIVVCRYSMIIVFTIGTIFIAQLYNISIGFNELVFIFFGSVLAAFAGAGAPGMVAISMINLVLTPLGLPTGAAIILLLAVNAIIDPILTVINIYLTCISAIAITTSSRKPVQGNLQNSLQG